MIFEKASRMKLRFQHKGQLQAEDLWDLPLSELDSLYRSLKALGRADEEGLLVTRKTREEKANELRLEIVKHVFTVKKAEAEKRDEAKRRADEIGRIQSLIAQKQGQALEAKPVEELTALLNELRDGESEGVED